MQRIGVNRVSFGAQTFAAPHRALFSLDATISQIHDVAEMATEMFVYTNIDMIYGMAGQTTEDLYADVNQALSLRTTTVDFYPLNNLAAQVRMHHLAHKAGLRHLTAARRVQYRRAIDEHLRAQGYSPINGYSYSRTQKSNRATLQHQPKFQYHDILYGYHDDAVLGYGASALTQVPGYNVYNHVDRTEYVSRIRAGALPWEGFAVGDCSEKGIVTFPYRGSLKKSRIPWERVPAETHIAFTEAIEAGLIIDGSETYDLSQQGWLFYVNLMYYLMPAKGKRWISDRIAARISNGRECEHTVLEEDEGEESRLQ
jgi:oxygen-independent coproporphyrinogen-3 oxidase